MQEARHCVKIFAMSQIQLLYRLQQVDTEIREKKQRLGDVLKAQKEGEEILAARKQVETAVSDVRKWQTRRQDLNLELGSLNDKLTRSEERLYSGNIRNPKELADLQHEVEALGRQRGRLEEETLTVMEQVEEAQKKKTAVDDTLNKLLAQWEKNTVQLKQEQNELALRLHHLTQSRQAQVKLIAPNFLKEYDTLSTKKGGVAVAGLRVNLCLGCRMTIPMNKVKEAQEGQIVHCGGCGRILNPVG